MKVLTRSTLAKLYIRRPFHVRRAPHRWIEPIPRRQAARSGVDLVRPQLKNRDLRTEAHGPIHGTRSSCALRSIDGRQGASRVVTCKSTWIAHGLWLDRTTPGSADTQRCEPGGTDSCNIVTLHEPRQCISVGSDGNIAGRPHNSVRGLRDCWRWVQTLEDRAERFSMRTRQARLISTKEGHRCLACGGNAGTW